MLAHHTHDLQIKPRVEATSRSIAEKTTMFWEAFTMGLYTPII